MTPYTPMDWRRRRAAERRLPQTPAERVEAMDNITAVWQDPATRPAGPTEVHDRYAHQLEHKET